MIKKILVSIYLGFVFYAVLSLFSGAVGFSNMTAMNYFKENLKQHVFNLEVKEQKLADEIQRLNGDYDRLTQAARPIGLVEPGQKMIKILNNSTKKTLYDIDIQYVAPSFKQNSNHMVLVSTMFTVILFVISLFIGVLSDTFKKR